MLTFGFVYSGLLGDNPNNAIMFAGVFLGIAALVMQWGGRRPGPRAGR
ncbi:hypothetical protein [Phycicoccus elongatus]|nr:hypothetical protein [Phycicoccus elongatus]HOA66038.1 hypothetical protein [Phycicoccus elongatus]